MHEEKQKHNPITIVHARRHRMLAGLLGVVGASLVSYPVFAQRIDDTVFESIVKEQVDDDTDLQELNGSIEEKAQEVRDLEERLNIYKENLEKKQKERHTLQNEIDTIEDRIYAAKQEIGKNSAELEIYKMEVEMLQKQIEAAESDIERNKELLARVVKEMYLQKQQSPLEVAFSHSSLSEYYSNAEYTLRIQQSMQETVNQVKSNKDRLQNKKEEISEKKTLIAKETVNLETQKEQLEGEQVFKDQLLTQTAQSEEEFQKLVEQVKAERAQLEGQIAALQGNVQQKILRIREEIRARLNDGDDSNDELTEEEEAILNDKLTFVWPVTSRYITCGFHCAGYPFQNYIGPHSGYDIATPMGTPIKAAAGGYVTRVVFDGSSRLGWVMIVHGDGLATVYMHVSGVNVKPDQYVRQGDVIARSGGMPGTPGAGLSTGPHLHFEVRLNGVPTNPGNYLP